MRWISFNIVALVCVGFAGYLAIRGSDGWGWFLFCGLLCAVVPGEDK